MDEIGKKALSMPNGLLWDENIYSHRQRDRLIRDLIRDDWAVTVRVVPLPPSDKDRNGNRKPRCTVSNWVCQIDRCDDSGVGGSRVGVSMWDCLRRAVEAIVVPFHVGTWEWGLKEVPSE